MANTANRTPQALSQLVREAVQTTPVTDIHTHLYDPAFSDLMLSGIDDLLIYHYLVAEVFRQTAMPAERFWAMNKTEQANLIWQQLFLEHSPISEACRGVITTLQALGLDVRSRDLVSLRGWFAGQDRDGHVTRCLDLAGVQRIYMTNSPFDDVERAVWDRGFARDERFIAGLRLDPLVLAWGETAPLLSRLGYDVQGGLGSAKSTDEIRRFLADWTRRTASRYVMVSLTPDFLYPAQTEASQVLDQALLPHCREHGLPLALMMGVKRAVNPALRLAGDGVGLASLTALQNLCARNPQNKFMATVLARENQHELAVLGRKFPNLHVFGCWWFNNVPSLIREVTTMRIELLGFSFTPQHSDARVMDQLIYKWAHSRECITDVLEQQYAQLATAGWSIDGAQIRRDVAELFGGSFESFLRR